MDARHFNHVGIHKRAKKLVICVYAAFDVGSVCVDVPVYFAISAARLRYYVYAVSMMTVLFTARFFTSAAMWL